MDSIRFINLEYFFNQIYEFFAEFGVRGGDAGIGNFFVGFKGFVIALIRFWLPLFIFILFALYLYYFFRNRDIVALERNRAYQRIAETQALYYKPERNTRWDRVVELLTSPVPSDWRVGIIEADAMLDSLVTSLGYEGDTLGEKLKSIEKGNFPTIDEAWEAHKVRNRIAHDGVEFQIDEVEKNRIFKLYEKVFSDAGYI